MSSPLPAPQLDGADLALCHSLLTVSPQERHHVAEQTPGSQSVLSLCHPIDTAVG